jgi:protein-S-isoprenylcysteine O-methyltransferase Ste14
MTNLVDLLFGIDVVILLALLTGAAWSVASPGKRIWPPPGIGSWQHRLTWVLFYLVFALNAALLFLDWNSWVLVSQLRFVIGIPLTILGALLVTWEVKSLGVRNTSGLQGGFISSGAYQFTRNPQYPGDMVLFIGLSLIANSLYLWITHLLTIMVFAVAPLVEETWLEEQYGDDFLNYKRGTSRFL